MGAGTLGVGTDQNWQGMPQSRPGCETPVRRHQTCGECGEIYSHIQSHNKKEERAFLSGNSGQIPEFDNDLVRRLAASIKVISADGFCNGVTREVCDLYGYGFYGCGVMGYFFDGKCEAEVQKDQIIR